MVCMIAISTKNEKDDIQLISITAQEKKVICSKLPDAYVVRTMKNDSKRHHYYMAETRAAMLMLHRLRGVNMTDRKET